jgi:hypothetical protein
MRVLTRTGNPTAFGLAFVGAYAAYELALFAATPVLGGYGAFTLAIIGRVGVLSLLWLIGLVAAYEVFQLPALLRRDQILTVEGGIPIGCEWPLARCGCSAEMPIMCAVGDRGSLPSPPVSRLSTDTGTSNQSPHPVHSRRVNISGLVLAKHSIRPPFASAGAGASEFGKQVKVFSNTS